MIDRVHRNRIIAGGGEDVLRRREPSTAKRDNLLFGPNACELQRRNTQTRIEH
jgi:hypothetical protein